MGQLTGISKRTTVQYIEVVADDSSAVLMVTTDGDRVTLQTRLPHEDRWDRSKTPTFTIQSGDKSLFASVINGADVSWQRSRLDEISGAGFRLPNPNPTVDEDEQRRCAELDIERAKAANLAEERELLRLSLIREHSLDKHITASVEGCEPCDSAIVASTLGAPFPGDVEEDDEGLPF